MAKKLAIDVGHLESLGGIRSPWTPRRSREIRLDWSKDKREWLAQQDPRCRPGWFLRVFVGAKAEMWLIHRKDLAAPEQAIWLGNAISRDEVRLLVKLLRGLRS